MLPGRLNSSQQLMVLEKQHIIVGFPSVSHFGNLGLYYHMKENMNFV